MPVSRRQLKATFITSLTYWFDAGSDIDELADDLATQIQEMTWSQLRKRIIVTDQTAETEDRTEAFRTMLHDHA